MDQKEIIAVNFYPSNTEIPPQLTEHERNMESSARSFGRYMRYLPSFLLNILPFPELTKVPPP